MNRNRFISYWRYIIRVWEEEKHAMIYGCGRETFAFWFNKVNKRNESPWVIREVLIEGVKRGWLEKEQSSTGHSKFLIRK